MEECEVSYSCTFRIFLSYYVAVTVGSNHDAYIYIYVYCAVSLCTVAVFVDNLNKISMRYCYGQLTVIKLQ